MIYFTPYIKGVIVGLVLSDGYLGIVKGGKNARLEFIQSTKHFQYLWFVFHLLSHYCSSLPRLTSSIKSGVQSFRVQFHTRSLALQRFTIYFTLIEARGGLK
jgi:hypothetical protein